MNPSPDDLRRYYDGLSDHALKELKPEDLTDIARQIYEAELANRGLSKPAPRAAAAAETADPAATAESITVAEFDSRNEAEMALSALQAAEIPAAMSEDGSGGYRIRTTPEFENSALGLLITPLTDEELAAQAEAAGDPDDDEI